MKIWYARKESRHDSSQVAAYETAVSVYESFRWELSKRLYFVQILDEARNDFTQKKETEENLFLKSSLLVTIVISKKYQKSFWKSRNFCSLSINVEFTLCFQI